MPAKHKRRDLKPERTDEEIYTSTLQKNQLTNYQQGKERRDVFLRLVIETGNIGKAIQGTGIAESTYHRWRARWPEFRAAVDSHRRYQNDPTEAPTWNGNFASFRERYFNMPSPWFHLFAIDVIEKAEPGSITMFLWPPEHGKTTLLEDYCNYKLALDPGFRISVGSERQEHSRKIIRRVRNRMENDGSALEYVAKYGPFAPVEHSGRSISQPWGADKFDVYKKGRHDERDYSMVALGMRSKIAGTRTDLLAVDDPQSLISLGQTESLVDQFRQDWLSRPGTDGKTWINGTRVGEGDFYETLIELDLVDNLVVFPAYNDRGEWLWPERYTPEAYAKLRHRVGEASWLRNYMQTPEKAGESTFDKRMCDNVSNPMRSVLHEAPPSKTDVQTPIFIMIDPAIGGANATMAAAALPDKFVPLDWRVEWGLSRNEQIFQILEDFILRYNRPGVSVVTDVIIETMAFQKGLEDDDRLRELQSKYGFRIRGHLTGYNKLDENLGIPSMAMSFIRNEIELPGAEDEATKARRAVLDAQLQAWRPHKRGTKLVQDLVMTLWFGWLRWRQNKNVLSIDPSQFSTRGLPYEQSKVLVGGRIR